MRKFVMTNNLKEFVASRSFSVSDQNSFANLSGDFNLIHMDPIFARRTIVGQCVLHGMHGLMWALESYISSSGLTPSSIQVSFIKPIFLDELVSCFWDYKNNKLTIVSGIVVFTEARLMFDTKFLPRQFKLICKPAFKVPFERDLAAVKNMSPQGFLFRGESKLASSMFPQLSCLYTHETCCEMVAISEVVGMQVPGLHSMLLSLKIVFTPNDFDPNFFVKHVHEKFNVVKIEVNGRSLAAEVTALLRPKPTGRVSLLSIKDKVKNEEFKSVKALIIGGSRGLGESVAKIIALGGGKSLITYAYGHDDAVDVANEICNFGGNCSICKLKVPDDLNVLDKLKKFNQVYYFATPKIFGKRSFSYDKLVYQSFHEIYVNGFKEVVDCFKSKTNKTAIYYPSSVAIDAPSDELAEYIQAKIEGENLCKELNNSENTQIFHSRIPRTQTDQTMTVSNVEAANPEDVMLPVVREMSRMICISAK